MPRLSELPPAAPERIGWPWTITGQSASDSLPDRREWPKITIVTPSYNQGAYLEATIRSVLLQGYPNLEYFVIDGGSSDDSLNVIERYAAFLTGWVSERDAGQTDAIQKGLARATGDVFNWLCSDDVLMPGALLAVGRVYTPGSVVYGLARFIDEADRDLGPCPGQTHSMTWAKLLRFSSYYLIQPATFLPLADIRHAGGPDRSLHYVMDWDLYTRLGPRAYVHMDQTLAHYRLHQSSKTFSQAACFVDDVGRITSRLADNESVAPPVAASIHQLFAGRTYLMPNVGLRSRGLAALAAAIKANPRCWLEAISIGLKGLIRPMLGEKAWAWARTAQAWVRG